MDAMSTDPATVRCALKESFTEFKCKFGLRKYRVRLFAVPVRIKVAVAPEVSNLLLDDVSGYINAFYHNGLVKKDSGLVLLNTLVGHEDLDASPMSALYALGHELFNCATNPSRVMPPLGRIGRKMDETSWLPLPDGYFTMRYLMGVVYWNDSTDLPGMYQLAANSAWATQIGQRLSMQVMTLDTGPVEISVGQPEMVFDALSKGAGTMIDMAMKSLTEEAVTSSKQLEAIIRVARSMDQGRTELNCTIFDKALPEQTITAMSVRLSLFETQRLGEHIERIRQQLAEHEISVQNQGNAEFGVPSMDPGHLH